MNDFHSPKLGGGGGGAPTASKLWGLVAPTSPPPRFPRPCYTYQNKMVGIRY